MRAPAKINLFLHVGPRRPDGYHDLFSLVVFADAGDDLAFAAAPEGGDITFSLDGPFAAALSHGADMDNLVVRAARLLREWAAGEGIAVPPTRIMLRKNLPVAAGIGGGSADAAAALKGLEDFWRLNVPPVVMNDLCLRLGADVPVCYAGAPSWMGGFGDQVMPACPLPEHWVVLINPGVPLSTGPVFGAYDADESLPGHGLPTELSVLPDRLDSFADLIAFLGRQRNDLEAPAISLCPPVRQVLDALKGAGAALARQSGSGPTCFGLYESAEAAAAAAATIARLHADWWIEKARVMS